MKPSTKNQQVGIRGVCVKGFTLIEVLVVMAILAALAGLSYGVFFLMNERAKESETNLIMEAVGTAMVARSADISSSQRSDLGIPNTSTYPTGLGTDDSTEDLVFYISGDFNGDGDIDQGAKPTSSHIVAGNDDGSSYLKEVGGKWLIVDSWGTPLRYTSPGVYHNEDDGFDLLSAGSDRLFSGTNADGKDAELDNIILK